MERPPGVAEEFGCEGEVGRTVFSMDCKDYHTCASNVVTAASGRAVSAHAAMERGFLPVAGGWQDQAAGFGDAVSVVSEVYREHEEAERASEDRRRQRARKG